MQCKKNNNTLSHRSLPVRPLALSISSITLLWKTTCLPLLCVPSSLEGFDSYWLMVGNLPITCTWYHCLKTLRHVHSVSLMEHGLIAEAEWKLGTCQELFRQVWVYYVTLAVLRNVWLLSLVKSIMTCKPNGACSNDLFSLLPLPDTDQYRTELPSSILSIIPYSLTTAYRCPKDVLLGLKVLNVVSYRVLLLTNSNRPTDVPEMLILKLRAGWRFVGMNNNTLTLMVIVLLFLVLFLWGDKPVGTTTGVQYWHKLSPVCRL